MTPTQICNLALAKLGDAAQVKSIAPADGSMQAQYCALFYGQALSVLMDKHAWAFATVTAGLAQAAGNGNPLWAYAYALPADYFSLVEVRQAGAAPVEPFGWEAAPLNADPFVEYEIQAGVLYCNLDGAVLVYVSNAFNDAANFQPMFVEALACLLASYLAGPILKGDVGAAAAQRFFGSFQAALAEAIVNDGQYRRVRPVYVADGVRARF